MRQFGTPSARVFPFIIEHPLWDVSGSTDGDVHGFAHGEFVINPNVRQQASRYRQQFVSAQPFPHVAIDYFFDADQAAQLLRDFPKFDPEKARNEFGEIARKAVVTNIASISPFYAEVYRYIASREFLDFISQLTGIPGLVHDEQMYGGGTHENLEGQELDPHVDFNFIEDRELHRRLNLLLYLNTEWETGWGGCLEIHSNPRRPRENRIQVIEPLFNRCVIFETSERSWHGFEKIQLPEGKKHLSRKLLSIYLYTRERPLEQVAPPHATFYVQRPLPARIAAGRTLSESDVREIEALLTRRDRSIEFYQGKELTDSARFQQYIDHMRKDAAGMEALSARIAELESYLRPFRWARFLLPKRKVQSAPSAKPPATVSNLAPQRPQSSEETPSKPWRNEPAPPAAQVPLAGYADQEGMAQGLWPDGWMGGSFAICARLRQPVVGVRITGYLPDYQTQLDLQIVVNGVIAARHHVRPGSFNVSGPCAVDAGALMNLQLIASPTYSPARAGVSEDARELAAVLSEVLLIHPAPSVS